MAHITTNYGEEYFTSNGFDSGATAWTVGVYDDASVGTTGNAIADADDLAAITTEPGGAAYARQTTTFSLIDFDGDATGLMDATASDNALSFDVSDSTGAVDSWFLVINFAATGDGGTATDHLVATGALSKEYDLSNVDQLDLNAGGAGVSLD